ncbi:MAG TPA: tyrosinase family protein [Steroidobacteraceae bacterium]|nr:tyrosinase family protein [Steroidobacteraceae bacterium]
MALGDGIRRNMATISQAERDRFINAILKMDTSKFFADGVSYWDKQEDIHKNGHATGLAVHGGIEFIPWHRALINHFEDLLREVDPELSLHYWDWTTDPRVAAGGAVALFTDQFMDNWNGEVSHLLQNFESTEGGSHPKIWRDVGATAANGDGTPALQSDASMLAGANDFATLAERLTSAHDFTAHSYIGGTISQAHYSFHDPFVFLLHSNLDRLWAKWQTDPAYPERLTPAGAYSGVSPSDATALATDLVDPWAGGTGLEPWTSDPTKAEIMTYTDLSVVVPRCYDTNQSSYIAAEAEHPFNAATNRFQINFQSVPEEETTWRAAVIRVYSCADATFRVKAGTEPVAPFAIVFPPFGAAQAHHDPQGTDPSVDVRIWFAFTAGATGTAPQAFGPINTTIECVEDPAISFNFELIADTIERETVAVQLVLDQSGSMSDPAGTSGLTRLQVLKDSATLFANLIQKNNGIGLIRFDENAYAPNDPTYGGMSITAVGSDGFTDGTRTAARTQITLHGAHGNTSVGDGIEMGRTQLDALPTTTYDNKAMIVFTDGLQNEPKSIEEVTSSINNQTFAIGLGTETQVNTLALHNITNSTGGYLLLSGLTTGSVDDTYRVQKYFMQILANVTNTQIVKDPSGYINVGTKLKIPFQLCEADITAKVILLNEFPIIDLAVETPDGQLITPANAAAYNATFQTNNQNTVTCDFPLPVLHAATTNHAGTWYAVLEVDVARYKRYLTQDNLPKGSLKTKGTKYNVSMQSFSNLKMKSRLDQTSLEPGATMNLQTYLTEYTVPIVQRASVVAEVERPDHTTTSVVMPETEPGVYRGSMVAAMAGLYRFDVIANGVDYKGKPFTREQLHTGAVFAGGDSPVDPGGSGRGGLAEACCKAITRLGWFTIVLLTLILLTLIVLRH